MVTLAYSFFILRYATATFIHTIILAQSYFLDSSYNRFRSIDFLFSSHNRCKSLEAHFWHSRLVMLPRNVEATWK